mmetsp:Transcript_20746/g.45604  ORF Transcript_20746/g.45604 Transcript_20746/m.45604 type:complete len:263 (-) Transcript_20746:728-1516(-)
MSSMSRMRTGDMALAAGLPSRGLSDLTLVGVRRALGSSASGETLSALSSKPDAACSTAASSTRLSGATGGPGRLSLNSDCAKSYSSWMSESVHTRITLAEVALAGPLRASAQSLQSSPSLHRCCDPAPSHAMLIGSAGAEMDEEISLCSLSSGGDCVGLGAAFGAAGASACSVRGNGAGEVCDGASTPPGKASPKRAAAASLVARSAAAAAAAERHSASHSACAATANAEIADARSAVLPSAAGNSCPDGTPSLLSGMPSEM